KLSEKNNVEECLILSTCNRVEVYAVSQNAQECVEDIKRFLSEFHSVSLDSFSPYLYSMLDQTAVKHLFRVASSLDSMVIGEPQILGQVKEAYRAAHVTRTSRLILNRLFHSAFFVAKKVRAETKIGSQAVSISYAAVELAKRIFDDLSKRTVMVIGTGDMAELAAKHLVAASIKDLVIANRTFESAESLAYKLKGKAIRIEEVHYFLRNVDIVITATGSSDYIIRPHHVREALKLRKNEPMFMIDIAVPRDVDPRVEDIPNIYLYDIDDLNGVLDENLKTRREHAKRAEEIVLQGEEDFQKWINGLNVVPAIISLKKRFDEIKEAEVGKALRRLSGLSEREKKIIESLASGIVGKILHNPVTKLKRENSTSLGSLYVDTIKRLFELDGEYESLEEDQDEASTKDWE
ncbi:MAG: glutamyl-tRNA reductase, partial [Candidatus Dadabacteria bacterium]|nr:glutamyl-tRNA reductase [Candidatus Dadabacteria bacterium]